jgi:hypothetical protein
VISKTIDHVTTSSKIDEGVLLKMIKFILYVGKKMYTNQMQSIGIMTKKFSIRKNIFLKKGGTVKRVLKLRLFTGNGFYLNCFKLKKNWNSII